MESILVVDDSEKIANFLAKDVLPGLGYQTSAVYRGEKALDIIKEKHQEINLLIVDWQLPDMTGLDLIQSLKDLGIQVPAILITGEGSEQVAVKAFRLGVYDYLVKPLQVDVIRESAERALEVSRLRKQKTQLTVRLKEQLNWVLTLSKIGRNLTSTLDLDEVLRRIVEAGVELTQADQGFIALLDEAGEQLYLRAVKNIDQSHIQTMRLPVSNELMKKVVTERQTIRINRNKRPIKVSTGFLVSSLIHVPIQSKARMIGVISVNSHIDGKEFSETDEAMISSLADYAAVAIENAHLYKHAQLEIEERRKAEAALRKSRERYSLAVRGANDGIWDWDLITNKVYYSPRWKSMLGFEEEEIGDSINEWLDRIHPDDIDDTKLQISIHIKGQSDHFKHEHRMLHKDGNFIWVLTRGMAVFDDKGNPIRIAGAQADITQRKLFEEQLLYNAFHDALTGVPNRDLFIDRLDHALKRYERRSADKFAVLFIDLDDFKNYNDHYGHYIGDILLTRVGERLMMRLRSTDTLARYGGDEFVILLEDVQSNENAIKVGKDIIEAFKKPFTVEGHSICISLSIGIVFSDMEYNRAEDVIRNADIAMYTAKTHGKGKIQLFTSEMRDLVINRLNTKEDFRTALENQELAVNYQPIVSFSEEKLTGFEALVRWHHPIRKMLYPDYFIPIAEESGLLLEMDRWVLDQACQQLKTWQEEGLIDDAISMSVNISGDHLSQEGFVEYVDRVIQDSGIQAENLQIEITERVAVEHDENTVWVINSLRELGVQVQIDDFGVGYSSLGYLSTLPLGALKIDRSLVKGINEDSKHKEVIKAIVTLTNRLNISVVAEGVETIEQVEYLRTAGCILGQGFYFSEPMAAERTQSWLEGYKERIQDELSQEIDRAGED
jgi:diguanylate cyclase (GGDEF)-like protein/PAS domain S-box-containing protein